MRLCLPFILLAGHAGATTLSGLTVVSTPHQVTVHWQTDVSATTELYWGPAPSSSVTGYPNASAPANLTGLVHSRTLSHLAPGTWYLRARSVDASAAAAMSAELTVVVAPLTDPEVPQGSWVAMRESYAPVTALARAGPVLFIGGEFNRFGRRSGAGLSVDASGAFAPHQPMVAGEVMKAVSDGAGGFFIAGEFRTVGGLPRAHLAHLLPDRGIDPLWHADTDGDVLNLVVVGTQLVAAGLFSMVEGQPRRNLVVLRASDGAVLAAPPAPDSRVRALAAQGTTVYLGGDFMNVAGTPRSRLAAFDVAANTLSAWNPGADGYLAALAATSTAVYVGGNFTMLGGAARGWTGAVHPVTGALLPWAPPVDSSVLAFAVDGARIFLGGVFSNVGATRRMHLAAVDATTGALLPFTAEMNNWVYALALSGTTLYAGGLFNQVNFAPLRGCLAAFDVSTAAGALLPFSPRVHQQVSSLALSGSDLYVAGDYSGTEGSSRPYLAALDTQADVLLPFDPRPSWYVRDLVPSGGTLFFGGEFTQVGNQARPHLAAVELDGGTLLPWNPAADGLVWSMLEARGVLYVGGEFTHVGGQVRNHLAAVDRAGNVLPWSPGVDGPVYALATDGTALWAGGAFGAAGGQARSRLAAFDLDSGVLLGFDAGVSDTVRALAVAGGRVFAGGDFFLPRARLAAFDAQSGALLPFVPQFPPASPVRKLVIGGEELFVAAEIFQLGNAYRRDAVVFHAGTGATRSWDPRIWTNWSQPNMALAVDCENGWLDLGGNFQLVGEVPQGGVASFRRACLVAPVVSSAALELQPGEHAVLHATVNPRGNPTIAWFRVDTVAAPACDDAFGARYPAAGGLDAGAGFGGVDVSWDLGPLDAGVTLHFCALAQSVASLTAGPLETAMLAVTDAGLDAGAEPPTDGGSGQLRDGGGPGMDGGAADGGAMMNRSYGAGCGCGAPGFGPLLLLALLSLRRTRKGR